MSIFKCKMCGGNLEVAEGSSVATCKSCGTEQTIPTSNDDAIVNLFNKANNLRLKCEFDRASETYEKILDIDDNQAEAHWGMVLCKYGIEYVDTNTNSFGDEPRKPTCHRTQLESILTDTDYLATIRCADPRATDLYKREAIEINNLQKKILDIVKNEKPFDVFICYKEKDENKQKTRDSVFANEIYHELTDSGLKVFFAAITLEDKLGTEYEPYIYAALSSAKVMLVLGTKEEYFNAVWVKNEWSRYLHMMKTDKTKKRVLIPCYRDMDAYDLPDDFSHLQALDMSGIAFMPDLIRNVKKLIGKESKGSHMQSENPTDPLLKRAFLFLEDGEFNRADEALEKVLDRDPENAKAYIGKLMIKQMNHTPEEMTRTLPSVGISFLKDNPLFKKANRFADDEYKKVLDGYDKQNKDAWYNKAKEYLEKKDFAEAQKIFSSISGHRDADKMVKECIYRKNDCIYLDAKQLLESGNYDKAKYIFTTISGHRDADEMANRCAYRKNDDVYAEANRLMESGEYVSAQKIFSSISGHRDADEMANECAYLEKDKHYNKAEQLLEAGQYDEAKNIFTSLNGHRDADEKVHQCSVCKNDSIYANAEQLLKSGHYDEAKDIFSSISGHRDADKMVHQCSVCKNDSIYTNADQLLKSGEYTKAQKIFSSISGHRDADAMVNKCAYLEKDRIYADANQRMEEKKYIDAQKIFSSISGHRDADEMANKCAYLEKDRIYADANQRMEEKKYIDAQKIFSSISGHRDADEMANECAYLEKDKHYNQAEQLLEAGQYDEAKDIFASISGHRDADEKVDECVYLEKDRIYANAEQLLKSGEYLEAQKIFSSISGHRDADGMVYQCSVLENNRLLDLAVNSMKHKDYAATLSYLQRIPGYKSANQLADKCRKLMLKEQANNRRKAERRRNGTIKKSRTNGSKKVLIGVVFILAIALVIAGIFVIPPLTHNLTGTPISSTPLPNQGQYADQEQYAIGVTSSPSGVTITVDGTVWNMTTPTTVFVRGAGVHTISLSKEGYEDYVETVNVASNNNLYQVSVQLKKANNGTSGYWDGWEYATSKYNAIISDSTFHPSSK